MNRKYNVKSRDFNIYRTQLHVLLIIITIVFIADQLGSNGNNFTVSVDNRIFAAVRLKS